MVCAAADAAFGPRVNVGCRGFDFTLFFEDVFLSCLPSAIFLWLSPYVLWLLRHERRQMQRSSLLAWKLGVLGALFVCNVAFLVERQRRSLTARNHFSLAADVLELIATVSAGILSYIQHCRSIRPSTLLAFFLSSRSLLGIARIRTLWLIPAAVYAAAPAFTAMLVFNMLSTVLESIGKASSLLIATEHEKPATPETFSGVWKRASFAWLAGTFRQGYIKVLSVDDLPDLDPLLKSRNVFQKLHRTWAQVHDKPDRYTLLRSCFQAYRLPFLAAVLPRLVLMGFTLCQPFLVNATVSWVANTDAPPDFGKALIGAYALVYVGLAVSTSLYGYQNFRFVIRLRGGLISLIHQQTIHAREVDLGRSCTTAITLMGTDVERIVTGFRSLHELWACPLNVGVAVYLLQRQVGVACLVPAVIVIVFVSLMFKLSAATKKFQRLWIEKVQERLQFTSHALENIKAIKMLGLSGKIFSIAQQLREAEITTSATFRKLLIGTITLSNTPADLIPMATFTVYVAVALVQHDNSVLAVQAFTSLSLLSLVTTPVLAFIQAVTAVIQCLGCWDRIQEYCSVPSHCNYESHSSILPQRPDASLGLQNIPGTADEADHIVKFFNYTAAWKHDGSPVLHDLTLTIQRGGVTMIVGPVGSGKSTLLESILGETLIMQGQVEQDFSSAAYCSQTPWLQSQKTISQNIIGAGASPIDTTWYATVLSACGLEKDLARLPHGDQTVVGNDRLSGGQKQRTVNGLTFERALARALYSRCNLFLLDDVFSGIDTAATETISQNLFSDRGLFRQMQSTIVLTTHSRFLLRYADQIVVLADGRVAATGNMSSLESSSAWIQGLQTTTVPTPSGSENSEPLANAKVSEHRQSSNESEKKSEAAEFLEHQPPADDPARRVGDWSVYGYYASAAGRTTVVFCLGLILAWSFCREFPTIWLGWWTEANAKSPNSRAGMYLGVYIFLGVFGMVVMVAGCWLMIVNMVSNSALQLHHELVNSTVRAPIQFFQRVGIGSILNRFGQDMDLIDMSLPMEAINFLAAASNSLIKLIILAVFAKYLALAVPLVGAIIYIAQRLYLRTSRQLRLLDIEAKAPLYSHFLDLISGASTIRAFQWHFLFRETCLSLLDTSQRPVYMLYCVQQALGFILDLLVAVLAVTLVGIVVFLREKFDAGDVGVLLVMVMTFNTCLMWLIKFWTLMETSIGAVARVKGFVATTPDEQGDCSPALGQIHGQLPEAWPSEGKIQFSNIVAAHSPTSPPILKNITLTISPGSKLAICGPSGSGKTTLLLTLLRLIDLRSGSITIDDLDLISCSREQIRQRLNVVTQTPFLVPGTVRFNVDLFGNGNVSDERIEGALKRVGLWDILQKEKRGEDSDGGSPLDILMAPNMWSLGQRQLLCLARAMVRAEECKILLLDEATSSVDHATESTIQEVLETEFASHTILAVIHRLRYAQRYNSVAVLDGGALVEWDKPGALLQRESRFREMWRSGEY
ncbi:ABC transporter [Aspergillus stella-maris]|uniref:ABC transporter n=1 Tax=Aspergillus stella-maris TaxID=1810926 RepID=UPI003CCDAE35